MSHDVPTPAEIVKRLGLPASALSKAEKGEVTVVENESSSDKDLSLIVLNVLDAPIEKIKEFADELDNISDLQDATLSSEFIDPLKPSLKGMHLDEATVKELLKDPFLSKAEHSRLSKEAKHGKGVDAYKEILLERLKAYWEKGLHGIVPYEGKSRDPGADLKHANAALLKISKNPVVRHEIEAVPSKSTNESMHTFTWAIQKGNNQAAPVLNHLIVYYKEGEGYLKITNRFYSGADYDSSQIVLGVLPLDGGKSLLVYINRTYTAAVAGFGGGAKRSIGRKMMKSSIVETMNKAKKAAAGL